MGLKRTRRLTLTTLMAAAGVNLVACDQRTPEPLTWDQEFTQTADNNAVEALTYADVNACKAENAIPDEECDRAWQTAQQDHQANAPRYNAKEACEAEYGVGNCEQRGSGGGSFFTPFLAGMVIGNLLDGGGRRYYGGTGYYRDRYGRFGTPYGGRGAFFRDPATGRTQIGRSAFSPATAPAVQRAPSYSDNRAVSRGGFRSTRSYAGRGYGG
jgi:uncharacterized protein YgiB involved in biofilm formation